MESSKPMTDENGFGQSEMDDAKLFFALTGRLRSALKELDPIELEAEEVENMHRMSPMLG